jgi:DNA repair protein SbcC/Rad50
MRLTNITLKNIRSYTETNIDFPDGSFLLSGDIGSGKTTILIAIEFALFGLMRGITDGAALLRMGSIKGSVSLSFELPDKKITIHRELLQKKEAITQGNCSITINGIMEEMTPNQLKAYIFSMLGYPQANTFRSLIYRYTVFTSQEQMKAIIAEDAIQRLNTLRTLFGIDKYKQIVNNASTFLSSLRRKQDHLEGEVSDLPRLQLQKKDIHKTFLETETELKNITVKQDEAKKALLLKTEELNKVKQLYEQLKNDMEQLRIIEVKRKEKQERIDLLDRDITDLKKTVSEEFIAPNKVLPEDITKQENIIQALQKELEEYTLKKENTTQKLQYLNSEYKEKEKECEIDYDKEYSDVQTKYKNIEETIKGLQVKRKEREALLEFIQSLDKAHAVAHSQLDAKKSVNLDSLETCPTCEQHISNDHKKTINDKRKAEDDIIKKRLLKIETAREDKKKMLDSIGDLTSDYENSLSTKAALEESMKYLKESQTKQKDIKKNLEAIRIQITELNDNKKILEEFNGDIRKEKIKSSKDELSKLHNIQVEYQKYEIKKQLQDDGRKKILILEKEKNIMIKELNDAKALLIVLKESTKNFSEIEEKQQIHNKIIEESQKIYNDFRILCAQIQEKERQLTSRIDILNEQIASKIDIQNEVKRIAGVRSWLKDTFVPLMGTIEQHVFLSLYHEFNELFVRWFSMLMEDETLQARLDLEFAPVIEQNGYEIDVSNLSGGERTCVALAYRLALNKVVNDVVQTVHTKDILILDEPTEGFSTEQLDRVGQVLEQLKIPQLIIVSHEQKVENFVESILHVRKENHESSVESFA